MLLKPGNVRNLEQTKTIVRSPQPGDLGKLTEGNVLIERKIKIKYRNWIQELRGGIYELKLGGILGSVLGVMGG